MHSISQSKVATTMKPNSFFFNIILSSLAAFLILTLCKRTCIAIEDDVKCLEGIKSSLTDPQDNLASWSFTNASAAGFVCKFVGVSCWNERENRLISLELHNMSLAGEIPESFKYCYSLRNLDLSGNNLSGSIPPQICTWFPYTVTLDLYDNHFTGSIPPEMVNCKFLNNLILSDKKLSSAIPHDLGRLDRLKKFSVSNNSISCSIPSDLSEFQADEFSGNDGLYGKPLRNCRGLSKKFAIIIAAGVLGASCSTILSFGLLCWNRNKNRVKR